jgi:1-acyl-sn-glycerol-3-phosphate acyltransferase
MVNRRTSHSRRLIGAIYGCYGWAVFGLCALVALVTVLIVPGQTRRHRIVRNAARAVFVLGGVAPVVRGLEHVPDGHAVIVANHASFVDGILLKGYLPSRFSFVIKGELRDVPIVHFLLRRSGSEFVERFDTSGSARDARRILKTALGGSSLAFFPEGTFRKEPGVGRFRPGAFVAAVRGEMPIVPVAIRNTREMMPSGRNWPWPYRPRIDILPPIPPDDPSFADHRKLAENARQRILAVLDEPDLCKVSRTNSNGD